MGSLFAVLGPREPQQFYEHQRLATPGRHPKTCAIDYLIIGDYASVHGEVVREKRSLEKVARSDVQVFCQPVVTIPIVQFLLRRLLVISGSFGA